MRVTIDLMKKSTQIIDLSNVINPRVGDDDLLLPLHIVYGDNQTDMRGKDVEFISEDTNKQRIYVGGTCNTNTPGDNLYMGNLTFRFPAGTFKADGTYDPDKTMFRIVDKATNKVISSVNVKITVMKNSLEFDFDPDNTSYDSRLETMLHDFHDKGQTMLDEIKDLKNQANSNASGDTATTAKEAKKQADQNAGDISDLKGEVAGARGRFTNMADREDAQDTAINQKENITNANANYALLQQKDAQQDTIIANKAGKFELEAKLAQMDLQPEGFENEAALKAKYPTGKEGIFVTVDTGHKWIYANGQWNDCGIYQAAGLADDVMSKIGDVKENLIVNGSFANGKVAPTTAVTDVDKFDVISDLGRNWVRVGTNGKIVQFVGVNVPVTMYDINAYYTMHLQFDTQSSKAISLAIQVIYLDGTGKTIDTQRIDTATLDKWAPFHADLYFRFISDSYKKASSVLIRVVDTQAEAIDQLTFTGFKLNAIYNSQKNTNMNLIENGDFANRLTSPATPITPVDNFSVTYDLNRNWLTLGTNQKNVKYVGAEIPIREYGILMYYRAHLQLDVLASQKLDSISIQIAYYNDKGLIDVQALTNFTLAANTPSHISKLFNWDMNLFKQATRLALRVVDTNEEAIGSLMLTGISIVPLYKGQNTYSKNLINNGNFDEGLADSSVALSGDPVTYITKDYLGRSWLQLSTNGKPAQFVGARFPFIKGDVLNFYKMRLQFDAECSLATTLAVQVAYLDDKGTQIAVDSFKPLKLNKYQLTHYNTVFTLTSDSYAKASKLEVRIVDNNTEVIDTLMLTGLELTVMYAGDSDGVGTGSINSKVTTINSSLPVLQLSGDTTGMSGSAYKLMKFSFVDGGRAINGYASTKWQGDSSLSYPKKAYRIKTFEDEAMTKKLKFKPNAEWAPGSKFNIKAYYTDSLLGRDAINAKIGGAIWATEKNIPQQLVDTNNFGFIDGFPILLYINGEFAGVYSFNLTKGDYGEGVTAIEGARYTDATKYLKLPEGGVKLDGTDFDMVEPDDASDEIKKQINDLITFVSTSSDDDFKAKLNNYLDKESAIDYWIFCHLIDDGDAFGKNQQLLTYDNKKFFIHPYDLDTSYGDQYDGSLTGGHDSFFVPESLLFKRLDSLFASDLKKRYTELRSWLTPTYVINQYRQWVDSIGEDNYEKEYEKWKNNKSDFNYLKSQVYKAFKNCDQKFFG